MKRILFLCLVIFTLYGCGAILHSPNEKPPKPAVEQQSPPQTTQASLAGVSPPQVSEDPPTHLAYLSGKSTSKKIKERLILLAIKYKVKEPKIEKILEEYLATHRPLKTNSNYEETLVSLSNKYSVSLEKVAGVVMDYKDWLACGGA